MYLASSFCCLIIEALAKLSIQNDLSSNAIFSAIKQQVVSYV